MSTPTAPALCAASVFKLKEQPPLRASSVCSNAAVSPVSEAYDIYLSRAGLPSPPSSGLVSTMGSVHSPAGASMPLAVAPSCSALTSANASLFLIVIVHSSSVTRGIGITVVFYISDSTNWYNMKWQQATMTSVTACS
eukprot:21244-Heterococcus_DN1.PRE.1